MKAILFSFKGRINRAKFLGYLLVTQFIVIMLMALSGYFYEHNLKIIGGMLVIIGLIFGLWTSLALYIKRWHDLDKSGWWTLLILIPVISVLALLYLVTKKGTEGFNRFGEAF